MLSPAVLGTVFGVVFLGELPDKTMFASLVLAAKGRAGLVWVGAAAAFVVHVAIAVTVGGVLLTLLPHRIVEAVAAVLFLAGTVLVLRDSGDEQTEGEQEVRRYAGARTLATAFVVIFIAEWGDLTQILIANLAAKYESALWVGVASTLALWSATALAMLGGGFMRRLPVTAVRRVMAAILLGLAALTAYSAITGRGTII